MHEKIFSEAFNPVPCRVLGLKLRNYSIGHELALIKQGNPIITYAESSFNELSQAAQNLSLASAVEICCYRVPVLKIIWAIRQIGCNFKEEIKKFRVYRDSGSLDLPTTRQSRVSGLSFHYFGSPELARLINYVSEYHAIMINVHFNGSPLNFPLGVARMLYASKLECDGSIWVENFKDAELKEKQEIEEKLHPKSGVASGDEAVKESARKWNAEHPDSPITFI